MTLPKPLPLIGHATERFAPPLPAVDLSTAEQLVLHYAADSSSAQALQPALQHWISPQQDALAGYVDVGLRRVTAGLPVASPARGSSALRDYLAETRRGGRRAVFVAVDGERASAAARQHGLAAVPIGTQPIWQPAAWLQLLAAHRSLRSAMAGARNKQVLVSETLPALAAADAAVLDCQRAWLAAHPLPPLQFVLTADALGLRHERRIWIARRAETVVAYLVGWPVAARHGWLFELVRRPQAPGGTTELLLDSAMRAVAAAGAEQVTLGLSPLDGIGSAQPGLSAPLRLLVRAMQRHGRHLYRFAGLAAFRARLHPPQRETVWLLSDEPQLSLTTALAVFAALIGPQPARFLLETLLRRFPAG